MDRKAVQSRDLAIVGYDNDQALLEVTFRNGGVYEYLDVPVEIYEQLMNASSHGIYFNQNIKEKYKTKKLR